MNLLGALGFLFALFGSVIAGSGLHDETLYDRIAASVAKNVQRYPKIDRKDIIDQLYRRLLGVKRNAVLAESLIETKGTRDTGQASLTDGSKLKRAATLPLPNADAMGGDEPEGMDTWDPSLGQAVGGAPDCNGEGLTWLTGCARKSQNAVAGMGGMRDGWMNSNGKCDTLLSNFGAACVFGAGR